MAAKRGKRKSRGKREIYFVCVAAKKDGSLLTEQVKADDEETAQKSFQEKTRMKAQQTLGPFYEVKGTGQTEGQRISVKVDAKDVDQTGSKFEAIFKGWKFIARGLKGVQGYKDDELVLLLPEGPVDTEDPAPKPRFGGALPIIERDKMENVQPL